MNRLDSTRTTEYRYNPDGKLVELILRNEATGDEVTRWEYGVTKAIGGIASNELLRAKVYPDSDDLKGSRDGLDGRFDRVEYRYNRVGEIVEQYDQSGTVHQYDYDKLGRLVVDRVTTLGDGVDEGVQAIGRTYNAKGQVEKITSYADKFATVVVNEVQFEYDGFGQVTTDYQEHAGAVNPASSHRVSYEYATGGDENTARLLRMHYSRSVDYRYGSENSIDDLTDRIQRLLDGHNGPDLVYYTKRGVNATVRVEYVYPKVELTYIKELDEPVGDAGDQYTGLDRFNRIEDIRWINRSGETPYDVDRYQYGFDRAGNRLWRRNVVAGTLGLDEAYDYDGLYQLTGLERGNLNINRTTVGGVPEWDEAFTYDQAGNWKAYVTKVGGVVELDQTRRHNRANEITFLDGSNAQVGYDGAGNMTRMPKVGGWDTAQTNTWDAWNRLVRVEEGETLIGEYAYDGLTRRVSKTSVEGETEVTRHGYFSTQWQLLEERLSPSDTGTERTFVWGTRYIDDLVLRDCQNFPAAYRIYATHDQWHVTGLIWEENGVPLERYRYSAFGVSTVMDGDWDEVAGSAYGWETRYGAYRWDQETGLYCVRFRYLHPELGRWLSRDPINERGGMNIFAYVRNLPISQADPSGLVGFHDFSRHETLDRIMREAREAHAHYVKCCEARGGRYGRFYEVVGGSYLKCLEVLCGPEAIEQYCEDFNEMSPLTPAEDVSTTVAGTLGIASLFCPALGPAAALAGTPSFAQGGARFSAKYTCLLAASAYCSKGACIKDGKIIPANKGEEIWNWLIGA